MLYSKEKVNLLKFHLEIGDYFPFINILLKQKNKDIHNFVDNKEFLFLVTENISILDISEDMFNRMNEQYNMFIFYNKGEPNKYFINNACNDENIYKMFHKTSNKIDIYISTPNRKIRKHISVKNMDEFVIPDKRLPVSTNIPYLLVENVLSPDLLSRIIKYYDVNESKRIYHNSKTKQRYHVYPDQELEIEIDNKLSRSLFPEIRKIFYFDVKYRETYKIASYDANNSGQFHAHRDTTHPYQHRRYAMSLFLNDDYSGGEFELLEYGLKIKPKKNSALVFPGICSHLVNKVTDGSRKVIISFFCNERVGKEYKNKLYRVKSNFFKERNIKYSKIYPK
jgi:hypothetical protein